jgi:hypothetical protein
VAFTQDFKGRREPDAGAYLTVNGREYLVWRTRATRT